MCSLSSLPKTSCFNVPLNILTNHSPQGNVKPEEALRTLTIFEGKFTRLKEERDNISKAKEALELSEPGGWLGGLWWLDRWFVGGWLVGLDHK